MTDQTRDWTAARCLPGLVAALRRLGRTDEARDLHLEALTIRRAVGLRTGYADSLDAIAGLEAKAGNHQEAVRLLATSNAGRAEMGYPQHRLHAATSRRTKHPGPWGRSAHRRVTAPREGHAPTGGEAVGPTRRRTIRLPMSTGSMVMW